MAAFISVSTEAFEEQLAKDAIKSLTDKSEYFVRRPLRGISVKEDTYAVIKVVTANGKDLKLLNSSAPINDETDVSDFTVRGRADHTANFIAQEISEPRQEKSQVVETFGEDFVHFFGQRARFITVSGQILNTNDFNWKSEFWENYERYLRGTKLVENNAKMYLYYDDVVVEGYMMSAQQTYNSNDPYKLPFSFNMFVTNYAILSEVGSVFIPKRSNVPENFEAELIGGEFFFATSTTEAVRAENEGAALSKSKGGLTGFLADVADFGTSVSTTIQGVIDSVKNVAYGRNIRFPNQGIGNQLFTPLIDTTAVFAKPPTGVAIHNMRDEYVEYASAFEPKYDENEAERVRALLSLQRPQDLEQQARAFLEEKGIDISDPNDDLLLLGRLAFGAAQVLGSSGLRSVDGAISNPVAAVL